METGIGTHEHAGHAISGLAGDNDEGLQCVSVCYAQRLAEAGAVASVDSTGDSCDTVLSEGFNPLYDAELVGNHAHWKSID